MRQHQCFCDFLSDCCVTVPTNLTYCDEVCDEGVNIEETSRGFSLKLEIPSVYYKYIIGKKGETRARIQVETHTRIIVPKPEDKQQIVGKKISVVSSHEKVSDLCYICER